MLYRLNYFSRTAVRILVVLSEFIARDATELYTRAGDYDWRKLMTIKQSFAVDSVVYSSVFRHSHYAALKVKDAIADQFVKHVSLRPSVDTNNPDIRIHLHISAERCTLALDSSGHSLHKRGYRQEHGAAPISEVLAAGMILLSGWNGTSDFMDPMCGSGTLVIEAALIAANIAPGSFRHKFLFENWNSFDRGLFESVKSSSRPKPKPDVNISGSDISIQQIRVARKNISRAGLTDFIGLTRVPFSEVKPTAPKGFLIINPPYGERMQEENLMVMYQEIGTVMKHHFSGWNAWILSSNNRAMKHIGLRHSGKYSLFNGALKCSFQGYELYPGSKRQRLRNPV